MDVISKLPGNKIASAINFWSPPKQDVLSELFKAKNGCQALIYLEYAYRQLAESNSCKQKVDTTASAPNDFTSTLQNNSGIMPPIISEIAPNLSSKIKNCAYAMAAEIILKKLADFWSSNNTQIMLLGEIKDRPVLPEFDKPTGPNVVHN